ncbi:Aminotransferase tdiD [Hypsizygus marmoreus]|uniref:Aminotransferase tdiD n=1 Tax=Hypsizygus marmoreus TaxID=39966 RepID=A0A369KA48_HYPMA|nr:Aminotransferase tdiD [Hypsizygus marmoreus]
MSSITPEQVAVLNEELLNPKVKVTHSDGIQEDVPATPIGTLTPPTLRTLPAKHYTRFFSDAAKAQRPSPIRDLMHLEETPGIISLLAGKPNPDTFPFTSLTFTARSPQNEEMILKLEGEELVEGLQYGSTTGLKQLVDWVVGLQEFSHGRKRGEGWGLTMGSGSQDLIYKAVIALVNPGDPVLLESPVYAGVIPMFQTLDCEQVEVETDANGISSDSLRHTLENWPAGKPKPRILYTVPYGCNPTGMTATIERRKEVLRLAREHDFLILEDDPYYYLYYGDAPRPPSYFSLEMAEPEAGRVLRFDSLSKILSAGIRIGFATGPLPLLQAINRHTATSNLQVPTLTQAIVFKLLDSWGYEGFHTHTRNVSAFYRRKRDVFERAMVTHLSGLAEWSTPQAGMFFWFKLLLSEDSEAEDHDSEAVIRTNAVDRGVLALPGTIFLPSGRKTGYVRASFSLNSEEEVFEALKRIRHVVLDARAAKAATSG